MKSKQRERLFLIVWFICWTLTQGLLVLSKLHLYIFCPLPWWKCSIYKCLIITNIQINYKWCTVNLSLIAESKNISMIESTTLLSSSFPSHSPPRVVEFSFAKIFIGLHVPLKNGMRKCRQILLAPHHLLHLLCCMQCSTACSDIWILLFSISSRFDIKLVPNEQFHPNGPKVLSLLK